VTDPWGGCVDSVGPLEVAGGYYLSVGKLKGQSHLQLVRGRLFEREDLGPGRVLGVQVEAHEACKRRHGRGESVRGLRQDRTRVICAVDTQLERVGGRTHRRSSWEGRPCHHRRPQAHLDHQAPHLPSSRSCLKDRALRSRFRGEGLRFSECAPSPQARPACPKEGTLSIVYSGDILPSFFSWGYLGPRVRLGVGMILRLLALALPCSILIFREKAF
jgi:hypothetical protein